MYRCTNVPYQGTVVEMAQYEASEYAQSRWLVEVTCESLKDTELSTSFPTQCANLLMEVQFLVDGYSK